MARIDYGTKAPGDLHTADMTNEIAEAVNALGTAADVNVGTGAGNVPVLNSSGKIDQSMLPDALTGEGSGDVTGPSGVTDGRPALFDGATGKALKAGTAAQTLPSSGTQNYWLRLGAASPEWVSYTALITAISLATGEERLNWDKVKGLSSSGAGQLFAQALISYLSLSALDIIRVNAAGDDLEGVGAEPDELAPGTASSSSGAITLDFEALSTITTTTTEAITSIAIAGLPLYGTARWIVTFGGAHDVSFPATWWTTGTFSGVSSSKVHFVIYRAASTVYHVMPGATISEES